MTDMTDTTDVAPKRPDLTLPPDAAAQLRTDYGRAQTILEYGSGGSTVVAAELGRTVFSVESDAAWLAGMEAWFAANPPAGRVQMHHGDVGPTGDWGMPSDPGAFRKYPGYATSVWDRADFIAPDLVLVDGRFRVACFVTAFLRTTQPLRLLFDDYADRDHYHRVETLVRPTGFAGRMAIFDLQPAPLPRDALGWIAASFADPR
jgi:hypothetical protein